MAACIVAAVGALQTADADQYIRMHPAATPLPHSYQGPFVTRGDGAILAVESRQAHISRDDGKTWVDRHLFADTNKITARPERALLRTREGTVVLAFLNEREKVYDKQDPTKNFLPTYTMRSLDDGETWEPPVKLQDGWCGAVRHMIQLKSGRIVLPTQNSLLDPWRHISLSFVSDDEGKTWQKSNAIELTGAGSHAGAMEPTIVELADGRIYMLIRTSQPWEGRIWFWETFSADGGLTWSEARNSGILASTCCGTLARLSDGRIALLWNRPEEGKPYDRNTRAELALAFSNDECQTWTAPVVVSARPLQPDEKYYCARQSYPYLYEKSPGLLWITTMQGGLRMALPTEKVVAVPDTQRQTRPWTIVALGSSTTARRSSIKQVYEQRLTVALPAVRILNAGVGGDTTEKARKRFDTDVLAHRPDVVVIQLGGNDAAIDVWKGQTTPRVSIERYEENLVYFLETLAQHNARAILMTAGMFRWTEKLKGLYGKLPYDADDPDGFNLMLRQYAEVVRRLARVRGVPVVDVFRAHEEYDRVEGQNIDDLFLDGMHPNDAGHAEVAKLLLPQIQALIGVPE